MLCQGEILREGNAWKPMVIYAIFKGDKDLNTAFGAGYMHVIMKDRRTYTVHFNYSANDTERAAIAIGKSVQGAAQFNV